MLSRSNIVVGIGASAGGLDALKQFFSALPQQQNMSFVVVMHLLRDQRSSLSDLLQKYTKMPVVRIDKNTILQPGHVYVLPENKYVQIRNNRLILLNRSDSLINRAVDVFFASLADDIGRNAVGIILSGTGTDGSEGIKKIEQNGGFVMVQHPDSTVFDGMPSSAIKFDHPDVIDTPVRLAEFIDKYAFFFIKEQRA